MSWNCRCELCRRAFQQSLEPRRWTDFLRHRENGIIRADSNDRVPVYLTELDGEIVVTLDDMESYKTISELGYEEVILIDLLRGCEVEPVEGYYTPFNDVYSRILVSP